MDRYRRAIDAYCQALEGVQSDTLANLLAYYAEGVEFRDPFNHTRSKAELRTVFEHMFATVNNLEFKIHQVVGNDRTWILKWTLVGRIKSLGRIEIQGLSEVNLDETGLVIGHIDYWDSWAGLFCKVPIIGALFRMMGRLARA